MRTNGAANFFTLSPRQPLTPAPYAITAGNVVSGGIPSGIYGNAVTFSNANNNFSGAFSGSGANVTNVNAAPLGGLTSSNFWQLGGNNVAAGKFLGSTNNQPLELRVNNQRAMQLVYASNAVSGYSPNLIGGHTANYARSGVVGATIAGGGNTGVFGTNAVLADFGTVLGGQGNTAGGKYSTVGGLLSAANGQYSTALGGVATADADFATAMGQSTASGTNSTAMGQSTATRNNATAMGNSSATNDLATAMGNSTAGGYGSTAVGASLAKGWRSSALGYSTALGAYSTALGASSTDSGANASTAMGASQAVDPYCTAMGSSYAGRDGLGGGAYATAMGSNSWATGFASTALGYDNDASGFGSVAMGSACVASGDYSIAAGVNAEALTYGSFVWADGLGYSFYSDAPNQARFRATGGFIVVTGINGSGVATAGASLAPNATSWSVVSDRNAKKNLQPLDTVAVLDKLASIPITHWNYNWEADTSTPHLGPMAQDFKAAFYPGRDDKTITTLEFDGVELAAIQGLNQKLEEQRTELQTRDRRITELESRLARMERLRLETNSK